MTKCCQSQTWQDLQSHSLTARCFIAVSAAGPDTWYPSLVRAMTLNMNAVCISHGPCSIAVMRRDIGQQVSKPSAACSLHACIHMLATCRTCRHWPFQFGETPVCIALMKPISLQSYKRLIFNMRTKLQHETEASAAHRQAPAQLLLCASLDELQSHGLQASHTPSRHYKPS